MPEEEDSAESMLSAIAHGDETALTRLVARFGRPVRLFAGRFLGSDAEGEDLAQEVFLTVWTRAAGFDPARGRAEAWIWRIARNRCIDRQRRQRLRWLVGLDSGDEIADDAPSAERQVAARDRLAEVRHGIRALPGRQRMAMLLTAVGEMDSTAVAGIMGCSRGSVEQLLVRARRTLRAGLPDGGGERYG